MIDVLFLGAAVLCFAIPTLTTQRSQPPARPVSQPFRRASLPEGCEA